MRPRIGITPCSERGWRNCGDALREAGAEPARLSLGADPRLEAGRVAGLLVPGGGDFLPDAPYPAGVRFDAVAEEQLRFDAAVLEAALGRPIPFLGICYGMQLLALGRGGSLHHHLPHDVATAGCHWVEQGDTQHPLIVEAGTRLAEAVGEGPAHVNSRHHQAVAEPGALQVSARGDDGVIEAVEDPAARFCVGVQWHPERMPAAHREALFRRFVAACMA